MERVRKYGKWALGILAAALLGGAVFRFAVVPMVLQRAVENSTFLAWCRSVSPSDLEFATLEDSWNRALFEENYVLSEAEEEQLLAILHQVDPDQLELRRDPIRKNPLFSVYVRMKGEERQGYLLSGYGETDPVFLVSPSQEEGWAVGGYNKLMLESQELLDFAAARFHTQPQG